MFKELIKKTITFAAKELVREYVEQMSARNPLFAYPPVQHIPTVYPTSPSIKDGFIWSDNTAGLGQVARHNNIC